MKNWKDFVLCFDSSGKQESARILVKSDENHFNIYPDSINKFEESWIFMAINGNSKALIVWGENSKLDTFQGEELLFAEKKVKICTLGIDNCLALRRIFSFLSPVSHRNSKFSLGLGDRLGLASAGHLRLIKDTDVFPVLAQQSIRELNLTGRNYDGVLSDACWAVFQEGYTKGFGADGDHLKTKEEVRMALDCGYTMITLDCSEHIDKTVDSKCDDDIDIMYSSISIEKRNSFEEKYLNKTHTISGETDITFSFKELKRAVLIYMKAVDFAIDVYDNVVDKCGRVIDFEMSIDETQTQTLPQDHYFVAAELFAASVRPVSIAPKFHGEFQKGIDYKGEIEVFEQEFAIHESIARHFGYKLSIHSGSDKFSIFPIIADKTKAHIHLKTAGTNWLEALKVIAEVDASLFREIYVFALNNLSEAKKYYHVSVDIDSAPKLSDLDDCNLSNLLEIEASRQILHITYGLILLLKDDAGHSIFRDKIYSILYSNENTYYEKLETHLGRHIEPFLPFL